MAMVVMGVCGYISQPLSATYRLLHVGNSAL